MKNWKNKKLTDKIWDICVIGGFGLIAALLLIWMIYGIIIEIIDGFKSNSIQNGFYSILGIIDTAGTWIWIKIKDNKLILIVIIVYLLVLKPLYETNEIVKKLYDESHENDDDIEDDY